jgi:hypothetical protein
LMSSPSSSSFLLFVFSIIRRCRRSKAKSNGALPLWVVGRQTPFHSPFPLPFPLRRAYQPPRLHSLGRREPPIKPVPPRRPCQPPVRPLSLTQSSSPCLICLLCCV